MLLFFSALCFAQQKEYYVAGVDLSGGDTLKFGMNENATITMVQKKMLYKDKFAIINDTIIFDNIVLDGVGYDIVECYFGENKLYKIILKTYIGGEYVNQYPEMKSNPEVQRKLQNGEKFILQHIYKDTKSKYNLK